MSKAHSTDYSSEEFLNALHLAKHAGVALWGGGFALEAVADRQKDVWRGRPGRDVKAVCLIALLCACL